MVEYVFIAFGFADVFGLIKKMMHQCSLLFDLHRSAILSIGGMRQLKHDECLVLPHELMYLLDHHIHTEPQTSVTQGPEPSAGYQTNALRSTAVCRCSESRS